MRRKACYPGNVSHSILMCDEKYKIPAARHPHHETDGSPENRKIKTRPDEQPIATAEPATAEPATADSDGRYSGGSHN